MGATRVDGLLQEPRVRSRRRRVPPWVLTHESKAANERVGTAEWCPFCVTITKTASTPIPTGRSVPKTTFAVEIAFGGFGGGVGHHAGSENSFAMPPRL